MKIALCFSGHLRDLNETKEFWKSLIQKHNIDVYGSFWDLENSELNDTVNTFKEIYNPKLVEVENYKVFKETTQDLASLQIESPYAIDEFFRATSKAFGQFSMYYKVWRCNLLSKQNGEKYDLVIRARTDSKLDDNFEIIDNNMLNVPAGIGCCPSFPDSFGLNDCIAYAKPKIMDYYSFIYLQMMEYLQRGHYLFPPEHFLKVHFSKVDIKIRFFPNYITLTRKSKGTEDEVMNRFMNPIYESVVDSNVTIQSPSEEHSFVNNRFKEDFDNWLKS